MRAISRHLPMSMMTYFRCDISPHLPHSQAFFSHQFPSSPRGSDDVLQVAPLALKAVYEDTLVDMQRHGVRPKLAAPLHSHTPTHHAHRVARGPSTHAACTPPSSEYAFVCLGLGPWPPGESRLLSTLWKYHNRHRPPRFWRLRQACKAERARPGRA